MAREFSPRQRCAALVFLAPIFLFLIPSIVVRLGTGLDLWLQWPPILSPPSNLVAGCLLIVPSWLFAVWSIYSEFTVGRGTPVPLMATQQLVVQPPYTYCRNPMALGAIGMYLGVAILFRSLGAVVLVLLCAGALVTYIKRVEEPELEIRFGPEYLAYKRRTPFLLPRFAVGRRRVTRQRGCDTDELSTGSRAPAEIRQRFWLIVIAVFGTPALAALGWMRAWQVATTLPGVPDWDSTFTWAPLILVFLGPALLVLLASPAWVRPRDPDTLRTARLLVLIGCQSLVVFLFGACTEWWSTGGFPPTWRIITLELLASALTLVPSVLLLWHRDDGTSRGWRTLAVVAPALVIVLAIAVGSAIHGVPPHNPLPVAAVVA